MKIDDNSNKLNLIPSEIIENKILLIRGQKVMIDKNLARLYGVSTKRFNEQVKRNSERFPHDFMFRLTKIETEMLISLNDPSRSQFATLKKGHNIKYLPYAFTEQGIAMLSSVLHSKQAIQINIAIMRAFVKIRQLLMFNNDVTQKLSEHEHKIGRHDQDIISLFNAINKILKYDEKPKGKFGFI